MGTLKLFCFTLVLTLFLGVSANAQFSQFVPNCTGVNDTASFSNAVLLMGPNIATLKPPYKPTISRCALNNITIPSNVTLDFIDGTVKVNTGQTLTIVGPINAPAGKQIFFNATAGQGTVSFAGNNSLSVIYASWWGNDAAAETAAQTALATAGAGAVLYTKTASGVGTFTVGSLPTGVAGSLAYVTDGATATDCTIGGGSAKVLCVFNGSTWTATGSIISGLTADTIPRANTNTILSDSGISDNGTTVSIARPVSVTGYVTSNTGVQVGSDQVVGARQAAVADATGAGDVVARLNELLSRLRSHGLIASPPPSPSAAPGMLAWFKPDGLSAGALATWTDASGNGNDLTQGTAGNRPTVVASTLNGFPVVRFTAGSPGDSMVLDTRLTTVRTAYIVVKYDQSTTTERSRFMSVLADATTFHYAGNEGTRIFNTISASASVTGGSTYLNGHAMSPTYISKSGNYELYTIVTTGNTSTDNIANDRSAHWFGGDIAEIILYSQAHGTTDRQNVENHLLQKYNLSLPGLVVVDGNSISADRPLSGHGIAAVAAGDAWPNQMIPVLNATSFGLYDTYNTAVGGRTILQANSDAATAVDPLFNGSRAKNILVFMEGTNEMGPNTGGSSGAVAYSRLVSYFNNRTAVHPWQTIVITCPPRQDSGNLTAPQLAQFEIDRDIYNANILANWATFADAVVDIDTLDFFNNTTGASGADGTPDLADALNTLFYNPDKVHLTALGLTSLMKGVEAQISALP